MHEAVRLAVSTPPGFRVIGYSAIRAEVRGAVEGFAAPWARAQVCRKRVTVV